METINDRIQNIINERFNGNVAAFAREVGIPQTTLVSILGTRKSKPSYDVITKIMSANALEVSAEWLILGTKNDDKKTSTTTTIPLIPHTAAAGFLSSSIPGVRLEDCEQYAVADFVAKGADFLVRVSGDSMSPRYNNGDIVAVKVLCRSQFVQWGKVYVLDTTQGLIVKRILPGPTPNSILCRSEDIINYPDYTIEKTDIRAIALVIGGIKIE